MKIVPGNVKNSRGFLPRHWGGSLHWSNSSIKAESIIVQVCLETLKHSLQWYFTPRSLSCRASVSFCFGFLRFLHFFVATGPSASFSQMFSLHMCRAQAAPRKHSNPFPLDPVRTMIPFFCNTCLVSVISAESALSTETKRRGSVSAAVCFLLSLTLFLK